MNREILKILEKYNVINVDTYIIEYIEEQKYLDLVLFGHFSGGKTSFLNTFFGVGKNRKLLPVGKMPTTKKNWKISFGRADALVKCYDKNDKIINELSLNEIKNLNDSKQQEISHFSIQIPSPLLKNKNVLIWDTPGYNDPDNSNEEEILQNNEKLLQIIKRNEVAILVGSYEKIHNETTQKFLEKIKETHAKIIVIISNAEKNDKFLENKEKYVNKIQNFLKQIFPSDNLPDIFAVESKVVNKQLEQFYAGDMDDKDLFDMISVLEENGWREIYTKIIEMIQNARKIIDERLENKLKAHISETLNIIDKKIEEVNNEIHNNKSEVKKLNKKIIHFQKVKIKKSNNFNIDDFIEKCIYKKKEECKNEKRKFIAGWRRFRIKRFKNYLKSNKTKIKNRIEERIKNFFKEIYKNKLNEYAQKYNIILSCNDKELTNLEIKFDSFDDNYSKLIKNIDKSFLEKSKRDFNEYFSELIETINFDYCYLQLKVNLEKILKDKINKFNDEINEEINKYENENTTLENKRKDLNDDKNILNSYIA